ncbi:MAG: 16S rRNA (uracil(1498)-N(3))-methyltransferase [Rhodospirillaceae bacterium]|nr:16S rRNA (uracil(1498)-N(3))-methyltransferase [Rhodospirillaceae bacterium]
MSERRQPRLFVDQPLGPQACIVLTPEHTHYLVNVMRLKADDGVKVFNGRDGEWLTVIETAAKKTCTLRARTQSKPQLHAPNLWLAFAPLKRVKIDLVVEKATELGASVLWPVITQHTNAERVNLDRLRAIAVESAEQCERLNIPEVREPATLAHVMTQWPKDRQLFVLDETGTGQPLATGLGKFASLPCGFLVGPEGGFAQTELDGLAQLPFVSRVGLGPRILRAETAAIAALACWQSLVGDWR